jgi:CubicO group peptidase (beta-lactamase class C family)
LEVSYHNSFRASCKTRGGAAEVTRLKFGPDPVFAFTPVNCAWLNALKNFRGTPLPDPRNDQRHIDAHDISGAVTLVARKGQIAWFHAQGLMNIEGNQPMQKDAIFRVSMSKPICGVAILMLLDSNRFGFGRCPDQGKPG